MRRQRVLYLFNNLNAIGHQKREMLSCTSQHKKRVGKTSETPLVEEHFVPGDQLKTESPSGGDFNSETDTASETSESSSPSQQEDMFISSSLQYVNIEIKKDTQQQDDFRTKMESSNIKDDNVDVHVKVPSQSVGIRLESLSERDNWLTIETKSSQPDIDIRMKTEHFPMEEGKNRGVFAPESTAEKVDMTGVEVKLKNGMKVYKCTRCRQEFMLKQNAMEHKCTKVMKFVSCSLCNKASLWSNIHGLYHHINAVHYKEFQQSGRTIRTDIEEGRQDGKMFYKCTMCGKHSATKGDVKAHFIAYHLKLKPFLCRTCYESFSHIQDLTNHINIFHKKEQIQPEPSCHQGDSTGVKVEIENGKKVFSCRECRKHFTKRYFLHDTDFYD